MNIDPKTFFDEHGDKNVTEVPITFNDLYAAIKEKLAKDEVKQFEEVWEPLTK